MKYTKHLLSVLFLLIFTGFLSFAQKTDLDSKVPVDPDIRIGKLKNGLTYYIKKNAKPENRAELRLVVNAGSILENDDQQGLAHFVEHLCFNGTKHFKKSEMIDFLEKAGVKFGAHLNAYTSFDETVYMLQLPTDKPELMNKGYLILEDWAHNVLLEDEEIEKERGVIIEEWRLGLGANERMRQKYFPVLLNGSKYSQRIPIGKKEIVEKCKPQLIRDFYKDWYRPDLMAVIVVGDINVDETEKTIKEHFEKIQPVKNPKERKEFDIPDNDEPLICVASDKENTYTIVSMYIKHPNIDATTVGAYRNSIKAQLYSGMINSRIREISQKPDAPFIFASSSYGGFLGRTKSAYSSFAVPKENKINEAMEVLLAENEKVKRFGFTASELEREKKSILARYEKMANEADKLESKNLAGEYVRNYLEKEPVPGIKKENEYVKEFVPEITLEEINELAKKWITDKNIALMVLVKEAEGIKIPTEEEILAILKASKEKEYTAYVDEASDEPLMKEKPKPSKVLSVTEDKAFGITELTFPNNVKVILKPTDFKNDEILFAAYAPGGLSLFEGKDFSAAMIATDLMTESGFADFTKSNLEKKLAGNTAKISFYPSSIQSGVSGSASPKDFETLLQLNYQYFTNTRKDEDAFKANISQLENMIKFMSASPEWAFREKLLKVKTSDNPRYFMFPPLDELQTLTLEQTYKVYEKLFKTANDYTFVIVGNIDVQKIIPMLETYIGGLPVSNEKRKWLERKVEFPKGITEETVYKGKEDKSMVAMAFHGDFEWNDKNYLTSELLLKTLSIKLRESMREEQGGVYGVRASISADKLPKSEYEINVSWGCAPDNVDKLTNTVLDEMKKIAGNGPTDTDIEKAKETFIKDRETSVKENKFWLSYIRSRRFNGEPLLSFEDYKKIIEKISKKDLQEAAKKYFTPKHYVKVVLMPEAKKQGK